MLLQRIEIMYEFHAKKRILQGKAQATFYIYMEADTKEELEKKAQSAADLLIHHDPEKRLNDGIIAVEISTFEPEERAEPKEGEAKLYTSMEAKVVFRNLADLLYTAMVFSGGIVSCQIDKLENLQHAELEEAVMIMQNAIASFKAPFSENVKKMMQEVARVRKEKGIPNPKPMVFYE